MAVKFKPMFLIMKRPQTDSVIRVPIPEMMNYALDQMKVDWDNISQEEEKKLKLILNNLFEWANEKYDGWVWHELVELEDKDQAC